MSAQPQQTTADPAERLLLDDLEQGSFLAGVDRGYWRLLELGFPTAVIAITAAPRVEAPGFFAFRFDFTNYPEAPTARPWDIEAGAPLAPARWPAGGPRQIAAFNPGWKDDALYLPVDRGALQGHEGWRTQYAVHAWDPAGDLTQYLRLVHGLLNDPSYSGCRG
jgi:hypothetical protein